MPRRFFSGIDCRSLDYSPALCDWQNGGDAMACPVPMAASFEAKANVPDRMILDLDDAAFDRQVASWARFFATGSAGPPDVVHLHHLTPMHEAVRTVWPDVPVVTHLHGTELMMLAALAIDRPTTGSDGSAQHGSNGCGAGHGNPNALWSSPPTTGDGARSASDRPSAHRYHRQRCRH